MVCVNASNKDKDFQWMVKNNKGADITDESDRWAQIAVQGPKALELLTRVLNLDLSTMKPFQVKHFEFQGSKGMLATTGYTGERGGEIFIETPAAPLLWQDLLKKGADLGVQAIGLGARDTLRTEMKYSLYGHEIDDTTNPYAAGLGWVIKAQAKDFLGKTAMLQSKDQGNSKLIGFKMLDKGIPRQGYKLKSFDSQEIGAVTSGTHSPSLNEPIGIAYIAAPYSSEGTEFYVDIRGRNVKAKVVKTPFVQK